MIDLLIPAAPKDYIKVPHVIASVAEFVPDVQRVCLVAPVYLGYNKLHGLPVDCFTDDEIMPPWYDRMKVGWRPNWTTQQMIKLTQQVTETEYWLTTDADTFFNQKMQLFTSDGHPILYTGFDQYHSPYFGFNRAMLGVERLDPRSFLSECTLYKRSFVDELIAYCGGRDEFIRRSIEIINTSRGHPADSEIYAAWVLMHHKDHYQIRKLKQSVNGRYGTADYYETDVVKMRQQMRNQDCQTFSLHSWSDYWK